MRSFQLKTQNDSETKALGFYIAQDFLNLKKGVLSVLFLSGELGAGKTVFTKGFLKGLGYKGMVKSPTFSIVDIYEINNFTVFHFDLYRITSPVELLEIGIEEYLEKKESLCIFEWPERAEQLLPFPDLKIEIKLTEVQENNSRIIKFMTKLDLKTLR
tara:strand:- start:7513 stop:7986 length:474 start_codon:yes stop_codon:yes gene_type:complete